MNVTIEGTLFILDAGTYDVTICTWPGEEASVPVSHLCAFIDHVRSAGLSLPSSPPVEMSVPATEDPETETS